MRGFSPFNFRNVKNFLLLVRLAFWVTSFGCPRSKCCSVGLVDFLTPACLYFMWNLLCSSGMRNMSSEIRRRSMRSKTKASKGEDDEKIQKPVWVKLTGLGGGAWWPAKMDSHLAVSFWSDNSRMKVKKKCIKPFELHISSLVKFTRDKLKKAGSDLKEDFELDLSKATAMLQEYKVYISLLDYNF
ncbi:uncharacterized protein LOC134687738 [Mytilus trossulus]|uniref:uncharacterized protein LOC134687738 n=1 Tax=Mytilus trossulus TaxID=6551 RepID=UPI003005AEB0